MPTPLEKHLNMKQGIYQYVYEKPNDYLWNEKKPNINCFYVTRKQRHFSRKGNYLLY